MFRYAAIALLLLPGAAHAQKTVSVADIDNIPLVDPANNAAPAAQSAGDGSAESQVITVDAGTHGDSLVYDGASVEEIETLLTNAGHNAAVADEANALVARVTQDEDGTEILTLDVAGNDGINAPTPEEVANLEIGECNEGTNWITNDINCYNAYPVEAD
ncbi:hypothetical protein [Jannaschia marina]|uniref:hypothetical protein n=1 Tax=Jannaschia marina TaxID=2741674 RepID=UPI0015CC7C8B|nr:hypothetical protein [Jannaschia marina]